METSLHAVFVELQRLAEEQSQSELAQFANGCQTSGRAAVLLLAAADRTLVDSLAESIQPALPVGVQVNVASFADLTAESWRAYEADRLVFVFAAGEFLESAAHRLAQAVLLPRPPSASGVVFTGTEVFAHHTDLEQFQESLLDVLLPKKGVTSANTSPLELPVFFRASTSAEISDPALAQRLARDGAEFTAWLGTPISPSAEFDCLRALALVDGLEMLTATSDDERLSDVVSGQDWRQLAENLTRLRRRTIELIERTSSGVLRELDLSLDSFQKNVPGDARNHLQTLITSKLVSMNVGDLHQECRRFVQQALDGWVCKAAALIHKREAEMLADATEFVDDVDWRQVGEVAQRRGLADSYPSALLAALLWDRQPDFRVPNLDAVDFEGRARTGHSVSGAALAGTAGFAAASLFPFGTLGLLAGALLGAASGAFVGRQLDQREGLEYAATLAHTLTSKTVTDFRCAIHTLMRNVCLASRERAEKQIAQLIELVELEARAGQTLATKPVARDEPWTRLRERIAALTGQTDSAI
ncbi:MAG: hypothetical protein ACKV2Q_29400 [Planctomycetaceae bacterium]